MRYRKPFRQVSLDTGNWTAWIVVIAILAFAAGWIARALSVSCWPFPVV